MVDRRRAWRLVAMALAGLVCGTLLAGAAHAQAADDAAAMTAEVFRLQQAGKYSEATEIAQRLLAMREKALGPEHREVVVILNFLAVLYRAQGQYAEAESIVRRTLAVTEKAVGVEHPQAASLYNFTALLYQDQGRYAEAEELLQRALAIREKALGSEHDQVALTINNLATLYKRQGRLLEAGLLLERSLAILEKTQPQSSLVAGVLNNLAGNFKALARYAEAEALYKRSLAIEEKVSGVEHPDVARTLNNLGTVYDEQGRYAEAEPLLLRSLAIREKALGPEHPETANTLNNLGSIYKKQGRLPEAQSALQHSLAIWEKVLGPEHPTVASATGSLATVYFDQGRYADAEPLYRRSLAIREKALEPGHADVARALGNLANLYSKQGREAEAEPLSRRALSIYETALGSDHPEVAHALGNLAGMLADLGRHAEAEPLAQRALATREKAFGSEHPDVATSLNELAALYHAQRRFADAEPLDRRSLAIREKVFGPDHPDVALSLNNLAVGYFSVGRYAEAEQLHQRGLRVREKVLGPDHPGVATSFSNLGAVAYLLGNWARAVDYLRRSTAITARRAERGLPGGREDTRGAAQQDSGRYQILLKAAYRLAGDRPTDTLAAEMLETAQWAFASQTAASLAQMAARSAAGSPLLAGLVRERQDLVGEWQAKDKLLIAAKSEAPAKRNAESERVLVDRLAAIDTRLAEIDRLFARDFPDYAALAHATPVSVADVQAQLGDGEALVLFNDTGAWKPLLQAPEAFSDAEATFIWVVTKSQVRWVRSELGTAALAREVAALRCGLDATAWEGDGDEKCTEAMGGGRTSPLHFDHARAHALYDALFGEVQHLIKGKHLLIVPSGPLTQLPFHVLVAKPPTGADAVRPSGSGTIAQASKDGTKAKGGAAVSASKARTPDHRAIAWLAREHAVTVLPAVTSLKALRRVAKPSSAPRPMIGIGNPLLDGPNAHYASLAKLAQAKQRCPGKRSQQLARRSQYRASSSRVETRGGLASVADIKGQAPLPETADELCAVAEAVNADTGRDILLGAKATEREVKRLSTAGDLAKYRTLHFATHGVLAGDLKGTHEPGLILTPPATATEEDDGYLSASEIAALKLDAEWVILSACNTAAGAATSAEALSGLARAFIYAQARALLVSHWEVYSDATVKLITAAVGQMARDRKVGRAEALRRAMLAMIDKGEAHEAHPAYWAPFIVVGEGAAR